MILREPRQIDVKGCFPCLEVSPYLSRSVNDISGVELSPDEHTELLNPTAWDPILEMYGRTMKVAVALTGVDGSVLGRCHNAQPMWDLVHGSILTKPTACPFCLTPSSPCTAVADALRTGVPTIVRDQAGLTHVAVPLSLGKHALGAIIAGQVLDQYPDTLALKRIAKECGVSAQLLWHLSSKQRPISRAALQMAGELLYTLGHAFLRQRYGAILEIHVAQTNLQFRLLVEGVTDYALFTTDFLGRVTSWNRGAERMLGYAEGEIVGHQFNQMFTFEDIQNGAPEKQLLRASREGRSEDEGWRIRENRTQFWANVIITPLKEETDRHGGFAFVMQDVTAKRQAEIELETVRQERINLKDQFLSHVSHELRTPLTALYFFVTNLLDGVLGDLTSGQREHLEFSLENVKQLKDMVSDLLDVSRIDTLKLTVDPQQMFLPKLIDEVLRTCVANAALKNINLHSDVAEGLPPVWADRARVRQILTNLVDNGIKFTPENGTVTVRGRVFAEDNGCLCLSVVDTGYGISPENCDKVFDRLAQVKTLAEASRKGLGLGLFISRELVSQHGGRIWVESQQGTGSTFYFTLPVFSLAKLCESILTPNNLASGCVTLLSIDVSAVDGDIQMQDLPGIRKVLKRCILTGQDLLLPSTTETEAVGTFFVIACAETNGAEAITKRLRRELDAFDHRSSLTSAISVTTLQLSPNDQRWEERIAELIPRINASVQAHVLEREDRR